MKKVITQCYICGKVMKVEGPELWIDNPKIIWDYCDIHSVREIAATGGETMMVKDKDMWVYYVCAPLKAPTEKEVLGNIGRAEEAARVIAQECEDVNVERPMVFVPHSAFQFVEEGGDPDKREWALRMCELVIKEMVDVVVVCGERITEGMKREVRLAEKCGIEVVRRKDLC